MRNVVAPRAAACQFDSVNSTSLRDRILEKLQAPDYQPLDKVDLSKALGMQSSERRRLRETLNEMEAEGVLVRTSKERYVLPGVADLATGKLQVHGGGNAHLLCETPGIKDLFVPAAHLGTAMHGDKVVVRIERNRRGEGEGRVIRVLERANTTVVGILQHAYFPDDILAGYWGDNWVAVLSRSFPALADTFAFGMVAAVIYVALTDGALARWSTARLLAIASAVMMIGLFGSFALFIFNPRHLATVFAFASCALIILIVAPLARGEDSLVAKIVDWRPLKHIGTISLSTYLWHYPVLLVVERAGLKVGDDFVGISVAFAIVAIITIALGSVTYRLVELPAMRLR